MNTIRPVSDLRNNFADISKIVSLTGKRFSSKDVFEEIQKLISE